MIIKNVPNLKVTRNRFFRDSDQSMPNDVRTEIIWQSQSDTNNTKVYLNGNSIYLHSSVKAAMVYVTLGTNNPNCFFYIEYPSPDGLEYISRGSNTVSYSQEFGSINACIPLVGTKATNKVKASIYNAAAFTLQSDHEITYIDIVALYE